MPQVEQPTYYRPGNARTQTDDDALRILASGELWGRGDRFGSAPAAKAYVGSLEPGCWGIEFTTPLAPTLRNGGRLAYWFERDGGTLEADDAGTEWLKIPVVLTRICWEEGRDEG